MQAGTSHPTQAPSRHPADGGFFRADGVPASSPENMKALLGVKGTGPARAPSNYHSPSPAKAPLLPGKELWELQREAPGFGVLSPQNST